MLERVADSMCFSKKAVGDYVAFFELRDNVAASIRGIGAFYAPWKNRFERSSDTYVAGSSFQFCDPEFVE